MKCHSCGKEMWPAKYDGKIALLDGEVRCGKCAKENRPWNKIYIDRK
jgi:hypothetical protein